MRMPFQELVNIHAGVKIPPRFSVIAGEIIHHLRSSLDHIAWLLSSKKYRREHGTAIAFPICTKEPVKKEELAGYQRKVQGITSPAAQALIKKLQPYKRSKPMNNPLVIVHEFDRIDKHRTLVLVVASYKISAQSIPQQRYANPIIIGGVHVPRPIDQPMKMNAQITTQVAFSKFGKRKNQPIIPAIKELLDAIRDVVRMFAEL
jgi:hypothetical protein